jgi:hypothetical protein
MIPKIISINISRKNDEAYHDYLLNCVNTYLSELNLDDKIGAFVNIHHVSMSTYQLVLTLKGTNYSYGFIFESYMEVYYQSVVDSGVKALLKKSKSLLEVEKNKDLLNKPPYKVKF